jgi:ABC-type transport system involved in multi-copper enzyme maturation permease subunit
MSAELLHYRPWRGEFRASAASVWPIARVCLAVMFRRKLFWGLYLLGLSIFLLFFFGQFLLAWAMDQLGESSVPVMGLNQDPAKLVDVIRNSLKLNGSGDTYANYFWYQGYMVMIVLAFAGSILIGNDIHYGSLPFYLSKPLSRWHYLLGKCLAVGVFVNLMTTVPALLLFVQWGMLDSWHFDLLPGILGYGLLLTIFLSLALTATAAWLRRTVPMLMAWATVFLFFRLLAAALVDGLHYDRHLRLIDFWNDAYVLGYYFLGNDMGLIRPSAQPEVYQAALVILAACLGCFVYLIHRIRGVEIVN